MKIELTKTELKTMQAALHSAIDNEHAFIDAHTCQYCHGSKILYGKPCLCKTGAIRGSAGLIKSREELVSRFIKLAQKLTLLKPEK